MTSALISSSPLLTRPGAVVAEGPDAGVAWHYGDPTAEQRALEAGNVVVDPVSYTHLTLPTIYSV